MDDFEEFRQELHNALAHLFDPDYVFSDEFYAAIGQDPDKGAGALQSAIVQVIKSLGPDADVPQGSRFKRDSEVLRHRFVMGLTQEEAAECLHLSVRSLQRVQKEATHLLARRLWEYGREHALVRQLRPAGQAAPSGTPSTGANEWLSQVREELLSLQQGAPDAECEVKAVIEGVLRIMRATAAQHSTVVAGNDVPSGLQVRFHSSALRQVLLTVIASLEHSVPNGTIILSAKRKNNRACITVTADQAPDEEHLDISLAHELLSAQGGSIETQFSEHETVIVADLPCTCQQDRKATVLSVDDNADLVSLYRSYCTGTAYQIVHVQEGKRVLQAVKTTQPDLILLDVMLPDIDGWDLLLNLHADPATQDIPIIVCSVVTDEQLALDLGAKLYLRKPVWREELLEAFDQVLR